MADLISSKAVMQLDYANLIPTFAFIESCPFERSVCAALGHTVANNLHGIFFLECLRSIRSECLSDDLNCLILQLVFTHESFGCNDATRRAILRSVTVSTSNTEKLHSGR